MGRSALHANATGSTVVAQQKLLFQIETNSNATHCMWANSVAMFWEYTEITMWGLFKIGVPPNDNWVHILTYGYVMSVYVQFLQMYVLLG